MILFRLLARALGASCVLVPMCCVGNAFSAGISSGPMAGYSGRDRADIWLMTDGDARIAIDFWPARQAQGTVKQGSSAADEDGGQGDWRHMPITPEVTG